MALSHTGYDPTPTERYEYGIAFASDIRRVGKGKLQERHIHRDGMTLSEARRWVATASGIFDGSPCKSELFVIVRRPIGEWRKL